MDSLAPGTDNSGSGKEPAVIQKTEIEMCREELNNGNDGSGIDLSLIPHSAITHHLVLHLLDRSSRCRPRNPTGALLWLAGTFFLFVGIEAADCGVGELDPVYRSQGFACEGVDESTSW